MSTEANLSVKTLGRYAVGDLFFHGEGGASLSGRVEKIGRKYVTVSWEQFDGAGWTKQHLPEWLDGMGLNDGTAGYPLWEPNR